MPGAGGGWVPDVGHPGVYVVAFGLLVGGVTDMGTACSGLMFVRCVPVPDIVLLLLFFPYLFSLPIPGFLSLRLVLLNDTPIFLRGLLGVSPGPLCGACVIGFCIWPFFLVSPVFYPVSVSQRSPSTCWPWAQASPLEGPPQPLHGFIPLFGGRSLDRFFRLLVLLLFVTYIFVIYNNDTRQRDIPKKRKEKNIPLQSDYYCPGRYFLFWC